MYRRHRAVENEDREDMQAADKLLTRGIWSAVQ